MAPNEIKEFANEELVAKIGEIKNRNYPLDQARLAGRGFPTPDARRNYLQDKRLLTMLYEEYQRRNLQLPEEPTNRI